MKKFVCIIAWMLCSFYTWGTEMANDNFANPYTNPRYNVGIAAFESLLGPFGAVSTACATNFNQHGWTLWHGNSEYKESQ